MFCASYDLPNSVALRNFDNVGASTLAQDLTDFAVESAVRHRLLLGRINLYDNTVIRLELIQKLG